VKHKIDVMHWCDHGVFKFDKEKYFGRKQFTAFATLGCSHFSLNFSSKVLAIT
jgi:hypothetical protein